MSRAETSRLKVLKNAPPGYVPVGEVARRLDMTVSRVHSRMISRHIRPKRKGIWWYVAETDVEKLG